MFTLALIDTHTISGGRDRGAYHRRARLASRNVVPVDLGELRDSERCEIDLPPGWVLNAPPELNYTWVDLMHNIDGIRFFVLSPDDLTYDSCWHLGADNIAVTYGASDTIFADGFDGIL